MLDTQDTQTDGGVTVIRRRGSPYMDYLVVASAENLDYGPGDRVVVKDPNIGKRVRIDGTVYRLVREADIIGKLQETEHE